MKLYTKYIYLAAITTPLVVYATVSTDDGINTSGNNIVADGQSSVAIGTGNEASSKSLAVGENNIAGGSSSHAQNSITVGVGNTATSNSLAVGTSNFVGTNWDDSGAMGTANSVASHSSFAFGSGNHISSYGGAPNASDNIALGRGNEAVISSDSIVIGVNNISFNKSWIMGEGNVNNHNSGTVILGTYSDTPDFGEIVTEALIVGVGTDNDNRANGFIVHKNGDVVIPKVQGDISMGIYGQ